MADQARHCRVEARLKFKHVERLGERAKRLTVIPGNVPRILELPVGCKFVTRCPRRFAPCADIEPRIANR